MWGGRAGGSRDAAPPRGTGGRDTGRLTGGPGDTGVPSPHSGVAGRGPRRKGGTVSSTDAFLQARDFLLSHREDLEAARAGFTPPRLQMFNWALDYFD